MKKAFLVFWLAAAGAMLLSRPADAGEINSNEASVLATAQGTFEYKGKTYVAKENYIAQLRAKLMEDDVNLTADEAGEAIAGIYSNVETGVREGYLEETGKSGSAGSGNTSEQTGSGTDSSSGETGASGQEMPHSDGSSDGEPESTEGEAQQDVLSRGDFVLHFDRALNAISLTEQTEGNEISQEIQKNYRTGLLQTGAGILCAFLAILAVLLIIRKRGRLRKIVPSLLAMLLLSSGFFTIYCTAGIGYGLYSGKALVNRVTEEEYYNKVYASFHKNLQSILKAAGFPENVLDESLSERSVYLDGKLALEAAFHTSRSKDFLIIRDEVSHTLTQYLLDENYENVSSLSDSIGNLSGLIQSSYQDSLKFSYADYLKSIQQKSRTGILLLTGAGGLAVLLGIVILILSQKYVHRIFRITGWSSLAAAVALFGASAAYRLAGTFRQIAIQPEEYGLFFQRYLEWNSEFMLGIAGIGVLFSIVCFVALDSLKKVHKRNPWGKL